MNYIAIAQQGKVEFLQAIFGKPKDTSSSHQPVEGDHSLPPSNAPPIAPDLFDRMFS